MTACQYYQCYSILDYDKLLTSILDYFGSKQVRQRTVFVHVHVDERLSVSKDLVHRMTAL